jgi:hypothetical protein
MLNGLFMLSAMANYTKKGFQLCLGLLLLLPLALVADADAEGDRYQPFQAGDRFQYNLYWSRIKVGEAGLSFHTDTVPGASDQVALRMTFVVRTTGIANRIYSVDNRMETWLDPHDWRPLHHTKRQREGRRERDIELLFDWDAGTVVYVNAGNAREPVAISGDTQDPLSLLGKIARKPFPVGAVFEVPATDGREATIMRAEVMDEELTRTPLGMFESAKLDVATDELRGVFSKSPDAIIEVWFSNDDYRVPLRMRSEVAVGSFYGELSTFESQVLGSHEDLPSFHDDAPAFRPRRGRR